MTKKDRLFVSVIVPCKEIGARIKKSLKPALKKQSYKNFELIIITDKLCSQSPADKRYLGAKRAKGNLLAFIDDDAYPSQSWLKNSLQYFKNPQIAAVCGPGLTSPDDNLLQQISGLVWQTWLGAGGAGTYRTLPSRERLVDDYPSFNLIVRKKDFMAVGGSKTHLWPGEDTKLCHDLVYKLKKKIIYQPQVLVYHHRRPIFIPHLKQISRFGLHRGHFVRLLPRTSLKFKYFIPSLFVLGLIFGPFTFLINPIFKSIYLACLGFYLSLLFATGIQVVLNKKNLKLGLLLIPTIFLTHLVYGLMFIRGSLSRNLKQ